MVIEYFFISRIGRFRIKLRSDGRWEAMFEDEGLGSYNAPERALDDLANGHTYTPSCGDATEFGLPDDISDWTPILAR